MNNLHTQYGFYVAFPNCMQRRRWLGLAPVCRLQDTIHCILYIAPQLDTVWEGGYWGRWSIPSPHNCMLAFIILSTSFDRNWICKLFISLHCMHSCLLLGLCSIHTDVTSRTLFNLSLLRTFHIYVFWGHHNCDNVLLSPARMCWRRAGRR